jgi:hypothetical protein
LPTVSNDDVRDVINVSSAEVPETKVLKMIKRAEVTLELETDTSIDYASCTDAEKEFITVLRPSMPFVTFILNINKRDVTKLNRLIEEQN